MVLYIFFFFFYLFFIYFFHLSVLSPGAEGLSARKWEMGNWVQIPVETIYTIFVEVVLKKA